MISFKKTIQIFVRNAYPAILTWDEMEKICKDYNHRPDTFRRLAEPNNSPNIKKVYNDKNQIRGWVWIKDEGKEDIVASVGKEQIAFDL